MIKYIFNLIFIVLLFTPTYFAQNLDLAENYYKDYDYKNALKYFLKADANNETGDEKLFYKIAYCYIKTEGYKKALQYLPKGLKTSINGIDSSGIYWLYTECYFKLDQMKKMSTYFHLAQKTGPFLDFIPREHRFYEEGFDYITTSDIEDIYFKPKSIIRQKNIVKVWLKYYWDGLNILPQDEEKLQPLVWENNKLYWDETLKKRKEIELKRNQEQHRLMLIEFDCINRLSKVDEVIKYDKYGNAIESYNFTETNSKNYNNGWDSIVPGSVFEEIFEKICSIR